MSILFCRWPVVLIRSTHRFVDRDMLMRYHWGTAVGHVYTHQQECANEGVLWSGSRDEPEDSEDPEPSDQTVTEEFRYRNHIANADFVNGGPGSGTDGSGSDSSDEDWEPESDVSQSNDELDNDSEASDLLEMYGDDCSDDGYE